MFRVPLTVAAMLVAQTAAAEPLLHFKAGETIQVHGLSYQGLRDGVAYVSLSSEYVSVAVLSGKLKARHAAAKAGDILVTPIEGKTAERFMFDAARLGQTLSPDAQAEAQALLQPIVARQKRQRFFGLIEPVGLNAQTPAPPAVENLRRGYLSPDIVVDLRHQAGGDPARLNDLTAHRFIEAVAAKDTTSVAALIDPKPFTDASTDPVAWQAARSGFAARLTGQPGLSDTIADLHVQPDPDNAGAWILDNGTYSLYRLRIVSRDRADYVAALEAL